MYKDYNDYDPVPPEGFNDEYMDFKQNKGVKNQQYNCVRNDKKYFIKNIYKSKTLRWGVFSNALLGYVSINYDVIKQFILFNTHMNIVNVDFIMTSIIGLWTALNAINITTGYYRSRNLPPIEER